MLEDFTDENDQLIFQDDQGRFFKIAMCDADAEEGEDDHEDVEDEIREPSQSKR